jgi:hypothetical protein
MRSHYNHAPDRQRLLTRRQLLAAGALTGLPLLVWLRSGDGSAGPTSTGQPVAGSTARPSSATPAPTTSEAQPTPTASVATLRHDLGLEMTNRDVEVLQTRLHDLAFDPGPIDGYFGEATLRAVWAFEKLVMDVPRAEASGIVTPGTWAALHHDVAIRPRRTPGGAHLEVYLPEQVAVLFTGDSARLVSHVSSGQGIEWCDEVTVDNDDGTHETIGICGLSITPGGVYHFERKVEGWRNAKLGRLYKPVYFNYGIAIHGATSVPNHPASRGCVRFPMHIAEYLQDLVSIGDAVYVFDGVEEPEHYGAQPMIFDWPDPGDTTTTTTTTQPPGTTTTPVTTTAPATTVAPTTVPPTTMPANAVPPTTAPPSTTAG